MLEAWSDDLLLSFDGRVVEVFGFPGSESIRFHVRNLEVTVDEPDRKQRRGVFLKPASGSGGCRFDVTPEDWAHVEPLLDAVYAAMP